MDEADVYPNVRWIPTTSPNQDPLHRHYWERKLTLPVGDPFWNEHHPGDRWNCKCSLRQTDDPVNDSAIREFKPVPAQKGLENNPGKDGHLFSDSHSYFPKSCSSCEFYRNANKGLKNRIGLLLFNNRKKDCNNCKEIMNIIATLRSSKFPTEEEKRLSREKTNEFIKTIPLKKGLKVKLQNVEYLKELTISRAAVRNWRSHPHKYVIAKNEAITDIQKLFKRAEYYGWAEDDIIVNPNGNSFQKHPDVKYWLYYKVLIYDELSYICVKVTNEGLYVPYCINDQNAWKSGLVNKIRKNKPLK